MVKPFSAATFGLWAEAARPHSRTAARVSRPLVCFRGAVVKALWLMVLISLMFFMIPLFLSAPFRSLI